MSFLECFGVLTGVGVDVFKFFAVGAGVFKENTGAVSVFKKCDSARLWSIIRNFLRVYGLRCGEVPNNRKRRFSCNWGVTSMSSTVVGEEECLPRIVPEFAKAVQLYS